MPGGSIIQRAIPSTGEMLPVIGLGFGNHASAASAEGLQDVLASFVDGGGKFLDTMHQAAPATDLTAALVTETGLQNQLFLGLRSLPAGLPPQQPNRSASKSHIATLFKQFNVATLDLVQLQVAADATHWAALREAKNDGRIRYVGALGASFTPFRRFELVMRNEPIDFISVDYAIDRRLAEDRILPLAQDLNIAVIAHFPFGGANGPNGKGLFARAGNRPLPEWAADFDAATWAQFFLKYVISHPAVTVARVGTTNAVHMRDNIGGGMGRLPDEATRKRMAALVDAWLPQPPHGSVPALADTRPSDRDARHSQTST